MYQNTTNSHYYDKSELYLNSKWLSSSSDLFALPDHGGSSYCQGLENNYPEKIEILQMFIFYRCRQFWWAIYRSPVQTSTISPPLISWMWENRSVWQTSFPPSSLTVHWKKETHQNIRVQFMNIELFIKRSEKNLYKYTNLKSTGN